VSTAGTVPSGTDPEPDPGTLGTDPSGAPGVGGVHEITRDH
jgi:hypothetical protein